VAELVETRAVEPSPVVEPRTLWSTPDPIRASTSHLPPMPYLYILECCDGTFYVGSTWNLELRLAQHQSGQGARYTSTRLPVKLVFSQDFDRIEDAFAREKQVQGWSRAKRIALIEGRMGDLPGLSRLRDRRPDPGD
jgi:putative endonuclease